MKEKSTLRSKKLFEEAQQYLVGGVASHLHKSEKEDYPLYIDHALGSKLYDVDGNEYIDYMGAFGPMILGYGHALLGKRVMDQISKGSQYAAPTESLNALSRKLVEIIPCADLISYQCTGTEANMLALRLARAHTGKQKVVKFEGHYHGWTDELYISCRPDSLKLMGSRNQPWKLLESPGQKITSDEDLIILPWNDLEAVERVVRRHGYEIAAVITEPVMCNSEPIHPLPGYLDGLRKITAENDILLIFDEVITGFRLSLGGAQEYFQVTPDLSVFAKAVAGGYPLAGVAGKHEIMESGVHPAGTFNANPVSVAAALTTIEVLSNEKVYQHMAAITQELVDGVKEISKNKKTPLFCDSIASIWQIEFGLEEPMHEYRDTFKVDKKKYLQFYFECLKRGVRLHPSRGRFYTSAAHSKEDAARTLRVFDEVFDLMN